MMSILDALEIERLKAVKDGVYVCTNTNPKEFQLIPLDQANITINGEQHALGKLLFSLIDSNRNLSKEIDEIKTNHNKLVKGYKKQIAALKVQIAGGKE